jgi:hypothetical protein
MNNYKNISDYMNEIISKNYTILDIKDKNGDTDYLDFIKYTDISSPVTIGKDKFNRSFFVIRANIIKADNSTESTLETFFQRYTDCYDLWHGCGHDGHYFISTQGGIDKNQAMFLIELVEVGYVNLTEELMTNIKFDPYFANRSNKPIRIELY